MIEFIQNLYTQFSHSVIGRSILSIPVYAKKVSAALWGSFAFSLVTVSQAIAGAIILIVADIAFLVGILKITFEKLFQTDSSVSIKDRMVRAAYTFSTIIFIPIVNFVLLGVFSYMLIESASIGAQKGWDEGFSAGINKLKQRVRLGFNFGYINHLDEPVIFSSENFQSVTFESYYSILQAFFHNQGTEITGTPKLTTEQFEAMKLSESELKNILKEHQRLTHEEIDCLNKIQPNELLNQYKSRIKELEETQTCPIDLSRDFAILVFQETFQDGEWKKSPLFVPKIFNREALQRQCCEFKAEYPETRESMRPIKGAPAEGMVRFRFHDLIHSVHENNVVVSDELNQLTTQLKRLVPPLKMNQPESVVYESTFNYAAPGALDVLFSQRSDSCDDTNLSVDLDEDEELSSGCTIS